MNPLARYILVCTESNGQEICAKDKNLEKISDDLLGMFANLTAVKLMLKHRSEDSCPGFGVMETCGDRQCNGIETEASCPADCGNWGLASFNYQVVCDGVQKVYHPSSVEEIQDIVNSARENGLRVKVVGGAGYNDTTGSASSLVCTNGIVIAMNRFDASAPELKTNLEMFEGVEVVNVASGTSLHELGEWLYERGKGIGWTHLGWRDVSVGGAIATSAHGSSPRHNNVVSHRVVSLDVVGPDGKLNMYSRGTTGVSDPDLWKSMTASLGYLGIVTRARIAVEKSKNVQVKVTFHDQEELFEKNKSASIFDDIKACDYGQYNWFPSQKRYMKTCGKETDAEVEEGANNHLLQPYVDFSQMSERESLQVFQAGSCQPNGWISKRMANMRLNGWHLTPPLVKTVDGKMRYTGDAIGPLHRMTSSHLIKLERSIFQLDWEIAIPAKNMQSALEYIKEFAEGMNSKNRKMAIPLIGIFIRFSKTEDETLMAYTGTGGPFEDGSFAAHIEMPIYVPVNFSEEQMKDYMAPYEEAQRLLIKDFGGRGHWAKNQHSMDSWLFEYQNALGSYDYDDRLQRFSKKVGEFDPNGMFSNRFAKVIGIEYPNYDYPVDW